MRTKTVNYTGSDTIIASVTQSEPDELGDRLDTGETVLFESSEFEAY